MREINFGLKKSKNFFLLILAVGLAALCLWGVIGIIKSPDTWGNYLLIIFLLVVGLEVFFLILSAAAVSNLTRSSPLVTINEEGFIIRPYGIFALFNREGVFYDWHDVQTVEMRHVVVNNRGVITNHYHLAIKLRDRLKYFMNEKSWLAKQLQKEDSDVTVPLDQLDQPRDKVVLLFEEFHNRYGQSSTENFEENQFASPANQPTEYEAPPIKTEKNQIPVSASQPTEFATENDKTIFDS